MAKRLTVAEQARRDEAFAFGVCSALAVVAGYDAEVIWRDIVSACGGYEYLQAISAREGNTAIDGFDRYRPQPRARKGKP